MENPFTKHCRSVGETYSQHLVFAVKCGLKMTAGGLACMIHGLLPFCFLHTGSQTVFALYERFTSGARRNVRPAPAKQFGARKQGLWHNELGAGI